MAEIKIGGVSFNVSIDGPDEAPALLVAHSLGSDLSQWEPQMPSLTRRFRVIRYDSRGHGLSEPTPGPYSIDQLGRDALGVLDALGVEKTHFMGLSLGGLVGMWLMANAPERIDRAILANTNACFGHPDLWNARIRQARSEGLEQMAAATMDRWFTRDFQESAPADVNQISARFRATSTEAYAASAAALRDADLHEAIRGVTHRVLVIVGAQDQATPPVAGGLIAERITNSRLVALEAAHLSNIEAANDFTRVVISFLTAPAAVKRASAAKTAKKAAKKPVRTGAKKAVKKVAKKAAKKAMKKAGKKTTAKKTTAKKATVKKATAKRTAAKRTAAKRTAAKKTAKKAVKKTAAKSARAAKSVRKATKSVKKAARKTAAKSVSRPAKKAGKKTARKGAAKSRR